MQGEGPPSPDLTFCFLIKLLFYVSSGTLKILIFQYSSLLQVYKIKKSEALEAARPIGAGAYPGFCSMKRLEVFLLPLDGMLVHRRSLPRKLSGFPQQFAGTHLYTWVDRGTVKVKCLA